MFHGSTIYYRYVLSLSLCSSFFISLLLVVDSFILLQFTYYIDIYLISILLFKYRRR